MLNETLYQGYKLKKDYLKALKYHESYKSTNDSLFNADNSKKIANIEAQVEIERKQKEIEILNKNKQLLEKDNKLQRIENERRKNAQLVVEKQAEADRLTAMARQEKDKRKQDSLTYLALQKHLEVEKHLAQAQKLEAESKMQETQILKEKEAKEFQRNINYLISAGFLSVLLFAYFIYRSRQKEKKAKEEIREQKEEIQQINEELNTNLNLIEQERRKSDKLLLNILPIETAHELKETGVATPRYYEMVSILFTDFEGFTTAVEKLKAIEVIQELDFCFNHFDEIVEKYGLERIKTIGDSYMAAGGLPIANQSNPADTVCAGLEIQAFMHELKAQREAEGKSAWQCRLGIHTGEVIAGVVGTKKFAYDVWGDTVNLASRMESSGEIGRVNISGATYEIIKAGFQCTYRGKIPAKNKGVTEMYFADKKLSSDMLNPLAPNLIEAQLAQF
jgi:class 3 adenylate cyclase